jgi:hypothetical protein
MGGVEVLANLAERGVTAGDRHSGDNAIDSAVIAL